MLFCIARSLAGHEINLKAYIFAMCRYLHYPACHQDVLASSHKGLASFPGLHAQTLSLAVRKAGGRPGRIYHVMRAAADVT